MKPLEILQQHQTLCDELHALALEENRFLQEHHTAPETRLQDRKRSLLVRMTESVESLRQVPPTSTGTAFRQTVEQTRSRILQFLRLDKENEQLLLRYSLAPGRPSVSAPPAATLGRLYGKTQNA